MGSNYYLINFEIGLKMHQPILFLFQLFIYRKILVDCFVFPIKIIIGRKINLSKVWDVLYFTASKTSLIVRHTITLNTFGK